MRSARGRLLCYAILAAAATIAVTVLFALGGVALNPWWLLTALLAVAVLAWLAATAGDAPPAVAWPLPRTQAAVTEDVHERGVSQAMAMFAAADNGSVLSVQDVAHALADATARKLILRGADPADPFGAAEARLSPELLRLCRATLAKEAAPRLNRHRLDAYLKEILAL